MHQHPRQLPSMAPPSSPRPNTTRDARGMHSRANSEVPLYNESEDGSGASGEIVSESKPSDSAVRKLDQIVQVWFLDGIQCSLEYPDKSIELPYQSCDRSFTIANINASVTCKGQFAESK